MSDDQDLHARVARLEEAVARLTHLLGPAGTAAAVAQQPTPATPDPPGAELAEREWQVEHPCPGEDPFFALNALKQVLPAPGGVVYAGSVDLPGGRHADWQYGLDTAALTDEDWADRADGIAALSHPVRLQMLQEILLGMATVGQLSALDGVGTTGQIYHHLRTLTAAGWLQSTGRGRYEVPVVRIVPLLVLILAARR